MSTIKGNPEEPSDKIIDESQTTKKLKTQNSNSEVNLLEQVDQTSQSNISRDSKDQNVVPVPSSDIVINQSALKDGQKRSGKNKKSDSISVGEILKNEYTGDPTAYVDTYQELKYKGYTYKLEDDLLIRNESDWNNDFVCKLKRIIRPVNLDQAKVLAFIEVQWYYKKYDLPKHGFPDLSFVSENEVFFTNQKDFVMVDCINGLGTVLSYNEYDSLSKILPGTYYSRGKFDVNKKKVFPPFTKWEKHCICRSPLNPDFMYIQCDLCKMWFHIECLKMSQEDAEAIDTYTCKYCEIKENAAKENATDEKEKSNDSISGDMENDVHTSPSSE